jgi:hypothetical protein
VQNLSAPYWFDNPAPQFKAQEEQPAAPEAETSYDSEETGRSEQNATYRARDGFVFQDCKTPCKRLMKRHSPSLRRPRLTRRLECNR